MKSAYKYFAGLVFTGLLLMVLNNTAAAQHRGGGGGGGFHGGGGGSFHGGGGFHGGSSFGGGSGFHGGSSFHGGGGGFHGSVGVRPGANSYRGNVNVRGGNNFRGQSFRGGVNYSHRGYVGARAGYGGRNYGGGFYRGGRYYGGRGYYGGHYGYGPGFRFGLGFGYPHIGFYLGYLPFGYYPFSYGDYQYYYSDGAFYRPYNGGYQVVAPPVGASVPSLPDNAQSITIDGQPYFEASGVYYQEAQDDNGKTIYVVAGKDGVLNTDNGNIGDQPRTDRDDPIMDNSNTSANNDYSQPDNSATTTVDIREGDIIKDLPADCRKVTLNDKKYYVSPDNIFYEDFKDTDGTKAYRVASVPKQ